MINIKISGDMFRFKGTTIRPNIQTQSWYIHIWPDDGSFKPKHVAEILILITIYIVVLLTGINDYIIAIYNGIAPIKKKRHI